MCTCSSDSQSDRKEMVEEQIKRLGINDTAVLQALLKIPRHLFVEPENIGQVYSDFALPIKENQTISKEKI